MTFCKLSHAPQAYAESRFAALKSHVCKGLVLVAALMTASIAAVPQAQAQSQFLAAQNTLIVRNDPGGVIGTRAQEIENLDKEERAQALIADQARSAVVRAEAAYTDAAQRLAHARREASEAQQRVHQLQVEVLRLTQQAEASQARLANLVAEGRIQIGAIHTYLELFGRYFIDLTPRVALVAAQAAEGKPL